MYKINLTRARINAMLIDRQRVLYACASFAFSFCLGQARLFGDSSPFCAAFVSAVEVGNLPFALLGGVCALLLRFDGAATARLLAAVAACAAINYCVSKSGLTKNVAAVACVNGGMCMLLSGLTVLLAQGYDFNGFLIYLCETAITAVSAYFFGVVFAEKGFAFSKRSALSDAQVNGCIVSIAILLVSLGSLDVAGIVPSRIAAIFAILCASKWLGVSGGCVSGGVLGFGMSLGAGFSVLSGIYGFGGLVSGVFAPLGQLAQAAAFALSNSVVVLMNSGRNEMLPLLYEAVIASVAFALTPKSFFEAGKVYFGEKEIIPEYDTMKRFLVLDFKKIKDSLQEVTEAMEHISTALGRKGNRDYENEEVKQLVRDQFSTLAMALDDVGGDLERQTRFDCATAAEINTVMHSYGITPKDIICSETDGVLRVEIVAEPIRGKISRAALISDMENACSVKLDSPAIKETKTETTLLFTQKPALNLRIGKAQFIADESKMCGDSFEIFTDKNGNQIVVISDGMGTGPNAAVDGAVASWLFSKLIIAGLNFDSALRLSNSALIVKSEEETLATIDSVRINMHTGSAEFFKAGAVSSLICKGNKLYIYGNPSMPLGILREVEFDKTQTTLDRGDVLLMMSDGVSPACFGTIGEELRCSNKKDPTALAERVVEIAKKANREKHIDDITVVAIIVR